MTTKLTRLFTAWHSFNEHMAAQPVEDDDSRKARESKDMQAYAECSYFRAYNPWMSRKYVLLNEIEEAYEAAGDEISERERRLVRSGANTTCCCNTNGVGFAWCQVNWPMDNGDART